MIKDDQSEPKEEISPQWLREQLESLADIPYRDFTLKTCPQAKHLLGVRIPTQRKLAKEVVKHSNYLDFLDTIKPCYLEEIMVTGIIIASAPMGNQERCDYTMWHLPHINNWLLCDTFCNSFKIKKADLDYYWNFLMQLRDSKEEYVLRFLLVMLLNHYIEQKYLQQIFSLLDNLKSDQYYVEMAEAWLVAELFTKFPTETFEYFSHDQLSTFAHNKAIQKACESRRVSAKDKQHLRALKL